MALFDRMFLALRRIRHKRRQRTGGLCRNKRNILLRPVLVVVVCVTVSAAAFMGILELRLRPVVEKIALHQVNNLVTAQVNRSVLSMDGEYDGLVEIQRDETGRITAVRNNMARVNRLRDRIASQVLDTVSALDVHELGVPLGSLFDVDLLWAKGPKIRVHSLVVGLVSTQVNSQFYASGINQTIHRVLLDINIPLTVLLPGIVLETTVNTSVCVAETVIVGSVPSTYLAGGEVHRHNER